MEYTFLDRKDREFERKEVELKSNGWRYKVILPRRVNEDLYKYLYNTEYPKRAIGAHTKQNLNKIAANINAERKAFYNKIQKKEIAVYIRPASVVKASVPRTTSKRSRPTNISNNVNMASQQYGENFISEEQQPIEAEKAADVELSGIVSGLKKAHVSWNRSAAAAATAPSAAAAAAIPFARTSNEYNKQASRSLAPVSSNITRLGQLKSTSTPAFHYSTTRKKLLETAKHPYASLYRMGAVGEALNEALQQNAEQPQSMAATSTLQGAIDPRTVLEENHTTSNNNNNNNQRYAKIPRRGGDKRSTYKRHAKKRQTRRYRK
jgi:hypothetical protein